MPCQNLAEETRGGMSTFEKKTRDAQILISKLSPLVTILSSIIYPNQIHGLLFAQAGQPLEVLYSIP